MENNKLENRKYIDEAYDVVVVGAGHAGCEASLASARLGFKTLVLTTSMESVGDMPCNPNIGGTGKGHIVREIDALGGEMAINIDKTFIQSRMLNTSKGPAVHSLRVQADKIKYHQEMKKTLENQENLDLFEQEVDKINIEDGKIKSVETIQGAIFPTKACIVCTGTYLNGKILMGDFQKTSGPHGLSAATHLSDSLEELGFSLRRFKTGTPARVDMNSLDLSKTEIQKGDDNIVAFSFLNEEKDFSDKKQEACYLTYTTEKTKEIIMENLERSPMYGGLVKGIGPRYCPSIEDKMVRFPDRDIHQVFIEPESLSTDEMYVQGVSSTLPQEVQKEFYKTIEGLENCKIIRPAYGIEYDCLDSTNLKRSLESKEIENLFFAGQINGSSGYEEAAGQGLIAGINAALKLRGEDPLILDRSDAYIGVLIDDLVTKGTNEPYRMMTSRCEYRLTMRQDNADFRLTEKGHEIGLVTDKRYEKMVRKRENIDKEINRLKNIMISPNKENNEILEKIGSSPLKTGYTLYDLIKRPELTYKKLEVLDPQRPEQLNKIKPDSIGQASRISGVSPADINVLLIRLKAGELNG